MNLKNKIQSIVSQELDLKGKILHIVSTKEDAASKVYMNKKKQKVEEYGGMCFIHQIAFMTEDDQVEYLECLQEDCLTNPNKHAIIVQLPASGQKVEEWIYTRMDVRLDLDGLGDGSVGRLQRSKTSDASNFYVPATAAGIYDLIEKTLPKTGKKRSVGILSRSMLVGNPLSKLLQNDGKYITRVYDSRNTENVFCHDVVVLARGFALSGFELADLAFAMKEGYKPLLIDVTILRDETGRLCGEIPREMYIGLESAGIDFAPVPGGVGLLTVHHLLKQFAEKTVN